MNVNLTVHSCAVLVMLWLTVDFFFLSLKRRIFHTIASHIDPESFLKALEFQLYFRSTFTFESCQCYKSTMACMTIKKYHAFPFFTSLIDNEMYMR